jgi:hypothetical protein
LTGGNTELLLDAVDDDDDWFGSGAGNGEAADWLGSGAGNAPWASAGAAGTANAAANAGTIKRRMIKAAPPARFDGPTRPSTSRNSDAQGLLRFRIALNNPVIGAAARRFAPQAADILEKLG